MDSDQGRGRDDDGQETGEPGDGGPVDRRPSRRHRDGAEAKAGERPVVFDVYRRDCASHAVLKALSNRWVVLAVSALAMGPMRHAELARKLDGVAPKSLTLALRELERDGLATRTVLPGSPLGVEYALTPSGRELAKLLRAVCRWSETHAAGILVARARAAGRPLTEETWREIAGLE